jgi:hypothetical protein
VNSLKGSEGLRWFVLVVLFPFVAFAVLLGGLCIVIAERKERTK